jgi:hypothetical protein
MAQLVPPDSTRVCETRERVGGPKGTFGAQQQQQLVPLTLVSEKYIEEEEDWKLLYSFLAVDSDWAAYIRE